MGALLGEHGGWVLFVSKNACTGLLRDPIDGFEGKNPRNLVRLGKY